MKPETQQKILELVKNNYDSIAGDFSQTRKRLQWPELIATAKQVSSGDSLLDVACGSGRLLDEFQNKKIEYLGVDNSVGLINQAKKNYPEQNFQVDDLLTLNSVKNNYFDWVFCIAALHHIPGEDLRIKVLQNLKAKIKNNGRIILSVWRPAKNKKFLRARRRNFWRKIFLLSRLDFGDAIFKWGGEVTAEENRLRYYHSFTEKELKNIIAKAGLKIIEFNQDEYNFFVVLGR